MTKLQDVFTRFAKAFSEKHKVSYEGSKAMDAIVRCRTAALGGHVHRCDSCEDLKVAYNSCRNRNCPTCGNLKKEQWILDRNAELLPIPYFHTVFTAPHELNPLFLANPKVMYSLLFKAASQTLTKLALDPKFLGAQIGVTMVLHTWGQNLSFHPHVHCIVPGGGLSSTGHSFIRSKKKFFIPVRVLSAMFRGKFLALVKKAFYEKKLAFAGSSSSFAEEPAFLMLLDSMYRKDWVVYCKKPFKTPYHVVKYLSRYTHKIAIYDNRLQSMDEESITFRYRDYKEGGKTKSMKLDAMEFIRRFLLHVLPSGFQKIRYYGFLSNANRKTKLVRCMQFTGTPIKTRVKWTAKEFLLNVKGIDISVCPNCSGQWLPCFTFKPGAT